MSAIFAPYFMDSPPKMHAVAVTDYGIGTASLYGHVKFGNTAASDLASAASAGTDNGLYAAPNHVHKLPTAAQVGAAPTAHADAATTYGVGSASNYGHVKATSTTPSALGTAAVGADDGTYARPTHVHQMPTPAQVGAAPTAHAVADTTYGVASATNYGHAKFGNVAAADAAATASAGTDNGLYASSDHVHAYPLQVSAARDLQVKLDNKSPQSFSGAANATNIGVTGVLQPENGGSGVNYKAYLYEMANRTLHTEGNITITADGYIKFYGVIAAPVDGALLQAGSQGDCFIRAQLPSSGTVIQGLGSAASITVTDSGIKLPDLTTLIFRHVTGGHQTQGTFYVVERNKQTVNVLQPNDLFVVTHTSGSYYIIGSESYNGVGVFNIGQGVANATVFGVSKASSALPQEGGLVASAGIDNGLYAREGHVHLNAHPPFFRDIQLSGLVESAAVYHLIGTLYYDDTSNIGEGIHISGSLGAAASSSLGVFDLLITSRDGLGVHGYFYGLPNSCIRIYQQGTQYQIWWYGYGYPRLTCSAYVVGTRSTINTNIVTQTTVPSGTLAWTSAAYYDQSLVSNERVIPFTMLPYVGKSFCEVFVAANGNDSNHGLTSDKPKLTIQSAINCYMTISAGLVIRLGIGTFAGYTVSGTDGRAGFVYVNGIYSSDPAASTHINSLVKVDTAGSTHMLVSARVDANGDAIVVRNGAFFRGSTLIFSQQSVNHTCLLVDNGGRAIIENSVIDSKGYGVVSRGSFVTFVNTSNDIKNCTKYGLWANRGGIINGVTPAFISNTTNQLISSGGVISFGTD